LRRAAVRAASFPLAFGVIAAGVNVALQQGMIDDAVAVDADVSDQHVADRLSQRIQQLSERYACSTHGLDPGVIPVRSLVQLDGQVRVTSFDEGWAVLEGEVPGNLVAVCAR
jgi:hypothetical protein